MVLGRLGWLPGAALLFCAGATAADGYRTIPFAIEQISGSRPVVTIAVNGHPFPAMVHSNAGLFLQINHAQAALVGAKNLTHKDAYGIEAPGKVSSLGRDTAVIDRLEVGGLADPAVPVMVFEKPADITMLGLGWIAAHGVIVDFQHRVVVVPEDRAKFAPFRTTLLAAGYSAHPMRIDPADGRYLVTASINGQSAEMVVSTVADATLDTAFAARAGLRQGRVIEDYGGPSGATGLVYETTQDAVVVIDGWRSKARKLPIEDTYAYSKSERPPVPRGGYFGADFLIAHDAVIDFGARTLYLR